MCVWAFLKREYPSLKGHEKRWLILYKRIKEKESLVRLELWRNVRTYAQTVIIKPYLFAWEYSTSTSTNRRPQSLIDQTNTQHPSTYKNDHGAAYFYACIHGSFPSDGARLVHSSICQQTFSEGGVARICASSPSLLWFRIASIKKNERKSQSISHIFHGL